jgi:hypothetical protein
VAIRCHRNLLGHGSPKAYPCVSHGHGDHVGVLALCHESSGALTPPARGLPADSLDVLGGGPSQLPMAADLGGITGGPGAFHQSPSGMGGPGFGNRPLQAPLAGGIFGGAGVGQTTSASPWRWAGLQVARRV